MKKVLFLAFVVPSVALAQGRYDGSWQVTINTQRGNCDPVAYAYVDVVGTAATVRNAFSGTETHSAAGYVSPGGSINTVVRNVKVRGYLGPNTGSGSWISLNKQCSGVWSSYNRSR